MVDIIKSTALNHWASYLINGDLSDMTNDDIAHCDAWLKWVDAGTPVDCEDAGFMWRHDATPFGAPAGDCQEYTFLRKTTRRIK